MQDNETNDQENQEPSRRRFLKAAAATGVAGAVWAEPLIRGIPAYAADASSIVGSVSGLGITWSTMRANWEPDVMGMISRTSLSGDDFNSGNVCGVNAMWETTVSGETVTITATGGPSDGSDSDDESCSDLNGTATLSLEGQTGCIFTNVSPENGTVDMTSGSIIMWTGADGAGMTDFEFNIVCG